MLSSGDSYTTTGFNYQSTLPTSANPIGNPPYPVCPWHPLRLYAKRKTISQGYTTVGGVDWIDVAAVQYNTSEVFVYNYAVAGATTNATLVKPYSPTVASFIDQVNQFLATAAKKPASTPWTSENALFSVWMGINDIGGSWGDGLTSGEGYALSH